MRRIGLALAAASLATPTAASSQEPQPVPAGLSRVEPISIAGKIMSIGEIEHWARIQARAAGGRRSRKHLAPAADYLIRARWIEGEAEAAGIRVAPRRVWREFRAQRDEVFRTRRHFRRYLRESGQTGADVRMRVRLNIVSDRLRARAIGDATDPVEQQERLDAFVEDHRTRWRAVTLCTPRFARLSGLCSNSVAAA
jgi:hypothetical protein